MNSGVFVNIIRQNRLFCYFVCLILNLALISSCTKKEQGEVVKNGSIQLVINVNGFNSDEVKKKANINLNKLDNEGGLILNRKTYNASSKEGRLEIDLTSSSQDIHLAYDKYKEKSFSNITKVASAVPQEMQSGVTYCFMIYNTDGDLIDLRLGEIGSPTIAWVNAEDDAFEWYAYSFNSTDPIPLPDRNNPTITTSISSPLLFAHGTIDQTTLVSAGPNNLSILFDQKLSKVEVEVDTRSLFADIVDITANFEGTPITTGVFDIRNRQMISTTPVDVGNIQMRNSNVGSNRLIENITNYYTASTGLTSISVKFTEFTIQHPNRAVVNLLPQLPNTGIAVFNGFTVEPNGNGKLLKATLRPFLILPRKKFLTFGTGTLGGIDKGFSANANTPSGNFLRSPYNIGPQSNYIRMSGADYIDVFNHQLTTSNTLSSILSTNEPDVVIAAVFVDEINTDALVALKDFILSGGVVFLLTETSDSRVQDMFREVMNEPNLTLTEARDDGGVFKLRDVDPDVLNGIFGNVQNANWGQDGFGPQYMANISNLNQLVVYTTGSLNKPPQTGISMFRHTQRNLFFVGDTGFLSSDGTPNLFYLYPYLVGNAPNYFPIIRPRFGEKSTDDSLEPGKDYNSWSVSNSIIFANALAWLIERAHFYGRDANASLVNEEYIQPSEQNWNFRRD